MVYSPEIEFFSLVNTFKRNAISLMYQLVDSTAGMKSKHTVRERQLEFLNELDEIELATLGIFLTELTFGHCRRMNPGSGVQDRTTIRESMCVFEDKALRYGPHFVWATVAAESTRNFQWSQAVMQHGLDDMAAFERGQTPAYASLQSALWHLFCKKAECGLIDSWNVAKRMVGKEMAGYRA